VSDIHSERILILDFGSQYTQLIARRVREAKVYCEIFPFNAGIEKVKAFRPKGLILSGGPSSVYDAGAPLIDKAHLELGIPVLGICYGMQLLTHILGGQVAKSTKREYGRAELNLREALAMLCAAEVARKDERRIQMGMSIAKFPFVRTLENFEYDAQPSVDPKQIRELAPVLNSPTVKNIVTVKSSDEKVPIDCMLKCSGRTAYIFAACMRDAPATATFEVKWLPAKAEAAVIGENRTIAAEGGTFQDSFGPYDVRIYRVR